MKTAMCVLKNTWSHQLLLFTDRLHNLVTLSFRTERQLTNENCLSVHAGGLKVFGLQSLQKTSNNAIQRDRYGPSLLSGCFSACFVSSERAVKKNSKIETVPSDTCAM